MGIRTRVKSIVAGMAVAAVPAMMLVGSGAWAADDESPFYIEPELDELQRAPGMPESADELFNLLDDNDDGIIDSGEWRSQKMFVFYARDADQNYQLARDEIPGIADSVFEAADTDGDGAMSGFEYNQANFTQFSTVDADGEQRVTFDEFLAFLARIQTGVE